MSHFASKFLLLLFFTFNSSFANTIDFDKLLSDQNTIQKKAPIVVKGNDVIDESNRVQSQFIEEDLEARRRQREIRQQYQSSIAVMPEKTTGSSRVSAAPQQKTFICIIYCVSSSGPKVQHKVSASSRAEAASYMGKNANEICKSDGLGKASSVSFSENQCREN